MQDVYNSEYNCKCVGLCVRALVRVGHTNPSSHAHSHADAKRNTHMRAMLHERPRSRMSRAHFSQLRYMS